MPRSNRPGDVLAGRYRLVDLLSESGNGRFWRAHDRVLERHVALHVIAEDDERAAGLVEAARMSATVLDPRLLRVLDAERTGGLCYVVNEWGSGTSSTPSSRPTGRCRPGAPPGWWRRWPTRWRSPTRQASRTAGSRPRTCSSTRPARSRSSASRSMPPCTGCARADRRPTSPTSPGCSTARSPAAGPGVSTSAVPPAPRGHGRVLRPRQVRAGVPRPLDALCDEVLNPYSASRGPRGRRPRDRPRDRRRARRVRGRPVRARRAARAVQPPPRRDRGPPAGAGDHRPRARSRAADPPEPEPSRSPPPIPSPTRAGLPIFGDDIDDVSWLDAPETAPPASAAVRQPARAAALRPRTHRRRPRPPGPALGRRPRGAGPRRVLALGGDRPWPHLRHRADAGRRGRPGTQLAAARRRDRRRPPPPGRRRRRVQPRAGQDPPRHRARRRPDTVRLPDPHRRGDADRGAHRDRVRPAERRRRRERRHGGQRRRRRPGDHLADLGRTSTSSVRRRGSRPGSASWSTSAGSRR